MFKIKEMMVNDKKLNKLARDCLISTRRCHFLRKNVISSSTAPDKIKQIVLLLMKHCQLQGIIDLL